MKHSGCGRERESAFEYSMYNIPIWLMVLLEREGGALGESKYSKAVNE